MSGVCRWSIRLLAAMASGFLSAAAFHMITTSSPYSAVAFLESWILEFGAFVILFAAFIYLD
jgi:hypothetical protein